MQGQDVIRLPQWRRLQQALLLALLFALTGCGMRSIPMAENQVEAAWAEVLNQYKRRADLVPSLVAVVQGYAAHERETLEAVIAARAQATQTEVSVDRLTPETLRRFQEAQGQLSAMLSRLMVVVERYPDLKANENFRDLQVQLEGTENRIAIARRRYIEAVQNFNNKVTVPPESWYNALFLHKEKKPQFTVEDPGALEQAPTVTFE